ncbi:hypothetical protein FHS15_003905 [Paenibacillus castaneae]|nr:hypothetical protein [Paenibacillus castaneae]
MPACTIMSYAPIYRRYFRWFKRQGVGYPLLLHFGRTSPQFTSLVTSIYLNPNLLKNLFSFQLLLNRNVLRFDALLFFMYI